MDEYRDAYVSRPLTHGDMLRWLAEWFDQRDALVLKEVQLRFPDYIPKSMGTEIQDDLRVMAARFDALDTQEASEPPPCPAHLVENLASQRELDGWEWPTDGPFVEHPEAPEETIARLQRERDEYAAAYFDTLAAHDRMAEELQSVKAELEPIATLGISLIVAQSEVMEKFNKEYPAWFEAGGKTYEF